MLVAVTCFLFSHTLIAEFAISWLSGFLVIVAGWPIRTVRAEVPSIIPAFSFSITTSHFIPPSIFCYAPSIILLRYSEVVNQFNRIYDYGVCGKIIAWIGFLNHRQQFGSGLASSLESLLSWGSS